MSWWNWQDDEPNEFACGRIATDAWAENDCTEQLRYICERGRFFKYSSNMYQEFGNYMYS